MLSLLAAIRPPQALPFSLLPQPMQLATSAMVGVFVWLACLRLGTLLSSQNRLLGPQTLESFD